MNTVKRCMFILSILLLSGAVQAQPMTEARQAWKTGQESFDRGEYRAALVQFRRGYKLSGKGGFLFNMAECARMMGKDLSLAHRLYARYLKGHPQGKHVQEARSRCLALGLGPCVTLPRPSSGAAVASTRAPQVKRSQPAAAPRVVLSSPGPRTEPSPFLPPRNSTQKMTRNRPFYKHWALWVGVGVVLAGTATAIAVSQAGGSADTPSGVYTLNFN